jgi:hypothetical protein
MKAIIIFILITGFSFSSEKKIISNHDFTNQNWTVEQVGIFLRSFANNKMTNREIVILSTQARRRVLNILMLLAKMEIESSIVENNGHSPYEYNHLRDRAMGYGDTRSISVDGKRQHIFGGYSVQVYLACLSLRKHFDECDFSREIILKCSGNRFIPFNQATFSLYIYTPYYGVHTNNGRKIAGNLAVMDKLEKYKARWREMFGG